MNKDSMSEEELAVAEELIAARVEAAIDDCPLCGSHYVAYVTNSIVNSICCYTCFLTLERQQFPSDANHIEAWDSLGVYPSEDRKDLLTKRVSHES